MAKVYVYVVARDFGFAPNPFHGVCTLATCKPDIRRVAQLGDWVFGMGGSDLEAVGRCVFALRVGSAMSFDAYWAEPRFADKRPVRNGSRKMMVGDNIYHRDPNSSAWMQADSHHSWPDGTINRHNLLRDTGTDRVLVSDRFWYFGSKAPIVPPAILTGLAYENRRAHRTYTEAQAADLLRWLTTSFAAAVDKVSGDPFQFQDSGLRYSAEKDRIL